MLAALIAGSAMAGFVDAVVGGGGLILIPLLMVFLPGTPAVSAIATNKVASVSGTASATVSLLRTVRVDRRLVSVGVPIALLSAAVGALLASLMSNAVLRPIAIVLLVAVGCYVALKPNFGQAATGPHARGTKPITGGWRWALALIAIGIIAIYDGFFGPGTGTFLIIVLTALLGRNFIESVTMAKIFNTSTNLGALAVFTLSGVVMWKLGIILAVANIVGAQIGARMVITKGTGFVRAMLLVVVTVMAIKLTVDLVT